MNTTSRNIAHPLATVICAIVLIGSATLIADFFRLEEVQKSALQAIAMGILLLVQPVVFEFAHDSSTPVIVQSQTHKGAVSIIFQEPTCRRFPTSAVALVLAAAAVVGLFGLSLMQAMAYFNLDVLDVSSIFGKNSLLGSFTRIMPPDINGISLVSLSSNLLVGALTCLCVAIWEEGFFRGILISAIVDGAPLKNPYRAAVLTSAIVFGVLHMGFSSNGAYMLQGVLKAIQAGLFGYCLAQYLIHTGSLVQCVGIHTLFDFMYFAPTILSSGHLSEVWIGGTPFATIQLIITICLLGAACAISARQLRL